MFSLEAQEKDFSSIKLLLTTITLEKFINLNHSFMSIFSVFLKKEYQVKTWLTANASLYIAYILLS